VIFPDFDGDLSFLEMACTLSEVQLSVFIELLQIAMAFKNSDFVGGICGYVPDSVPTIYCIYR
jgi:hypothetical protein